MDNKRLGWAAMMAAVAIGAILAINQGQGWEMPVWLALSLLGAFAVMVIIAALVAAFEIRKWLKQLAGTWGIRTPIFRSDKPDPHQWLLNIANDDASNPAAGLALVEATIDLRYIEDASPRVILTFYIFNGGVYKIKFDSLEGRIYWNSSPLATDLEFSEGKGGWWRRYHKGRIRLTQYLPDKVKAVLVSRKYQLEDSIVRGFALHSVFLHITADSDGIRQGRFGFGHLSELRAATNR
jgi:hypothetical protein